MINIINPVPVFDEDHNVIKFKYNDGLIIHDCLTNTLNISYLIVRDLMVGGKTIDVVLSELKEHFNYFSDVRCHDRDLLIDLISNADDGNYPNYLHNLTKKDVFDYNYFQINQLCGVFLSENFKLMLNMSCRDIDLDWNLTIEIYQNHHQLIIAYITNSISVFDQKNNGKGFKYNNGLVIYDCLNNTLNVSYLIIRDLMGDTKKIDDVLSELKEHFGIFSDVRCHDRDFIFHLITDLNMKVDEYGSSDDKYWFKPNGENIMKYDSERKYLYIHDSSLLYDIKNKYDYNYNIVVKFIRIMVTEIYGIESYEYTSIWHLTIPYFVE